MRIRTVKPEFFTHEGLFDAEKESKLPLRVAFAGLWCVADKAGRFRWEPRRIGIAVLPYDGCDFSRVLDALTTRGFVVRYRVKGVEYGCIPSFSRHQVINNREKESEIPEPSLAEDSDATGTREPRVGHAGTGEGKGRERERNGNGKEGKGTEVAPTQTAKPVWSEPNGWEGISDQDKAEWKTAYPACDIDRQLAQMSAWLKANPAKAKKSNWAAFITKWLTRSQDRGGDIPSNRPDQPGLFGNGSRNPRAALQRVDVTKERYAGAGPDEDGTYGGFVPINTLPPPTKTK